MLHALAGLTASSGPSTLAEDGPLLEGLASGSGSGAQTYLFAPLGTPGSTLQMLRRSVTALQLRLAGRSEDGRGVDTLNVSCVELASGRACQALTHLVNTAARPVATRVTAIVDGVRSSQRILLPGESSIPLGLALPAGAHTVAVQVNGNDTLPGDDAAWAVVPQATHRTVLLVTRNPGSPLARALRAIPGLALRTVSPGHARPDAHSRQIGVTVVDGDRSIGLAGNLLLVNPLTDDPLLGKLTTITTPDLTGVSAGSPLLAGVDLSSLVIYTASRAHVPPWASPDVTSNAGPLLFHGVSGGRRVAVLLIGASTDSGKNGSLTGSNLSTLLAFPALLQNALQELSPVAPSHLSAGRVGDMPVARQEPVYLRGAKGPVTRMTSSSVLAALPALHPGIYALHGGIAGTIAANARPPRAPQFGLATLSSATFAAAPALGVPAHPAPWELMTAVAAIVALIVTGEWYLYTRRT